MVQANKSLRVPYALAVHDENEEKRVLSVLREKRTIFGIETKTFEKKIATLFGKKYGVMVNSGSSANLLAVSLLDLPPNSEVITPLLTFSTTVAPIVLFNLVPVFVDVKEGTYIIDVDQVEKAITKKTRALMIPLLLGNVPNLRVLSKIAKKYKLKIIEDSCDTLGATYDGRRTGEYSDISTTSFYGSHIITAGGGGGMVMMNDKEWQVKAKVLRGWGRGSASLGETEDVASRFKTKIGNIPYDAKFIFTEIGYNFLPMEMGSAFGNAQLEKLASFRKIRERNFKFLLKFFSKFSKYFILPHQDDLVQTQWLAFPLTIKQNTSFNRLEIVTYLEKNNIQTRPIFSGVITKHPGFSKIKYRLAQKSYPVTEAIMERGFLIGCHHGLEKIHLKKIEKVFTAFINVHKH